MRPGRSMPEDNDRELRLLRNVAEGNSAAFDELFTHYHSRLFRFIYRLVRSHGVADELVNDIMLVVWKQASTFRAESKVSTWIFGIAYRQAMRRLSRSRPETTFDADDIEASAGASAEDEDWIRRGLASLPLEQRVTTELVFFLGLTYEEVSKVTDCPVGTVKTRMFHARRKLRTILPGIAKPTERESI